MIQIWTNFKSGGTGQLSTISIYMMLFRSTGRWYTYLAETDDLIRISVYAVASVLNVVLVAQMVYYYYSYDNKALGDTKKKL